MELKEIQSLIKFIAGTNIDEVSVERKDFKISIKKHAGSVMAAPASQVFTPAAIEQTKAQSPASTTTQANDAKNETSSNTVEIKSPMIGTFYRKPSPDKPNFVEVGDEIQKGQVICIIEAMKLFNEIEAEISGKVVKVLINDSEPVEYDQPLFLVEPA